MESAMTAESGHSGVRLPPVRSSHGVPCIGGGAVSTSRPVTHEDLVGVRARPQLLRRGVPGAVILTPAPAAVTALRGEGAIGDAVPDAADRRGFGMAGQMPGAWPDG